MSMVQARGRASRARLVDAATALFAERGSRGTGIGAVAKRAGVSQATLIHHFGSKQGLLLAVLEELDARGREEWEEAIAPGGLAAVRRLPQVADWWERHPEVDRLRMVLGSESLDPTSPGHGYFTARQEFLLAGLCSVIERGQARGEFRADVDPRSKAVEVLAVLHGLNEQWQLDPDRIPLRNVLERYTKDLVGSLVPAT